MLYLKSKHIHYSHLCASMYMKSQAHNHASSPLFTIFLPVNAFWLVFVLACARTFRRALRQTGMIHFFVGSGNFRALKMDRLYACKYQHDLSVYRIYLYGYMNIKGYIHDTFCLCACMYVRTYIHTHIHTHIRTYTYIHTYIHSDNYNSLIHSKNH